MADDPARGVRRKRYAGTHPARFEDRYKEREPEAHPDVVGRIRAKGGTPAGTHVPILVPQILSCLAPQPGERAADCTLGYGGHALEIGRALGPDGVLVGLDVDGEQIVRTTERLAAAGVAVRSHRANFAGLPAVLAAEGLQTVDCILADLGVSSMQVDDPARGFSFRHDGPLDMRMDARRKTTAATLLASIPETELASALRDLSDEPLADRIAAAVVRERALRPVLRTQHLADLVLAAAGLTRRAWADRARAGDAGLHPAARTFQALRILVNDELACLRRFLDQLPGCLTPGGRVAILSFHSGEDRLVKHHFRDGLRGGLYADVAPDPVRAGPAEVRANSRSSSARLRWAVRAS